MAELLLVPGALGVLLALSGAVAGARAIADGRATGTPASIAVLAPLVETARLLRKRRVRSGAAAVIGAVLLLVAPAVRVLALTGVVLPAVGFGWVLVADIVWWTGAVLLARRRGAVVGAAIALELAVALALAAVVVALAGPRIDAAAARPLPVAAEAPAAFLLLLVVGGVLQVWGATDRGGAPGGRARLAVSVALVAQQVAAAVTAVLLLGARGTLLIIGTAVLSIALVLVARRFPVLRPTRLRWFGWAVLVPLAAVQLGIVVALTLLGG